MPYTVNFTDKNNKSPITVFDNTSSTDTSLKFPGRNVTGYGQIIAENFLHLLENFSGADKPINAVEGQLWYDTTTKNLQINDGTGPTGWKPASGIQKGPTEDSLRDPTVGELWVDTTNQQLRIYTGTRWLLVGPSESSIDGFRYGPVIETVADTDNVDRSILIFYIADIPVAIISKDSFVPKVQISGFTSIRTGLNLNVPNTTEELSNFYGNIKPKIYGIASSADSLNVAGTEVLASKFLRSDSGNILEEGISIRNNSGITIGPDDTFELSNSSTAARIYNKSTGASIDLQTNRNAVATTILRILDNKVGINNLSPTQALDVIGNITASGTLAITNNQDASNFATASIRTAGGVYISKNLLVGTLLDVIGTTQTANIKPRQANAFDLGDSTTRYRNVYAKSIVADELIGSLSGSIDGNANTATSLKSVTTFKIVGDVISQAIEFDGQIGTNTKQFNTVLTANIIKNKSEPVPARSDADDYILIYRESAATETSQGLLKLKRDQFVLDLGVPIGTIMPYAGTNTPYGYLLCDGSELQIVQYSALYDIIGTKYNGASPLVGFNTFRLPDLRGRFPLGADNMFNGLTVPNITGGNPSAGGGETSPRRVEGSAATTIGANAGQSKVSLATENLPDHTHNFKLNNRQYYAVRLDGSTNLPALSANGPTAPGAASYLDNSGGVTKANDQIQLAQPIPLMNPFLTINYIIRTGPPDFTTTSI